MIVVIQLIVPIGDFKFQTWLGVIEKLAVNALPGTTLIDMCIMGIRTMKPNIGPDRSQMISILSTLSLKTKFANIKSLVAPNEETNSAAEIRMAKKVTIPAEIESPVLVSTKQWSNTWGLRSKV